MIALADTGIVGSLPTVELENLRSGESEQLTLYQDSTLLWKYTYMAPTNASGVAGTNNDGTLNVWPNDWVRVTYLDAFDGTNTNVVKTDDVQIPIEGLEPPPEDEVDLPGGSSGSFFMDSKGRLDLGLMILMVLGLGYLGLRRKIRRSSYVIENSGSPQ